MARVEEKFDAELAAERDSYLRELLSNLEELETVILDLSVTDKETEQTRMLARQIHTIKGTAGSLGLDLLSAAAHRMEDLFADPRRRENTNEKFIDQLLAQNDLLASIAEAYLDDNERFLDDVRSQLGETAPATPAAATETKCFDRILIVEPSAATLQFCIKILGEFGSAHVSSVHDGYEALGCLLKGKFDAVITSLQVPTIDGQSLTTVVRTIPGPNVATPVILLTSATGALDPAKARPDYVVDKNAGLAKELRRVLKQLASSCRQASSSTSEAGSRVQRKILLVDDSREIHTLVRYSFKRFPHVQIVGLLDPTTAVETARRVSPDLVLLDVQMSPLSGQEVMRAIKAAPELSGIPVAFFTGTDDIGETQELQSLGACQIFKKPFSPKPFSEQVVNFFENDK